MSPQKEQLFSEYMKAVIDSRRDPQFLSRERLFGAFQTLNVEVPFEQWVQKLEAIVNIEQPQEEPAETPEVIAKQNESFISAVAKCQPEYMTVQVKPNKPKIIPITSAVKK
jgi:hypothetical protein